MEVLTKVHGDPCGISAVLDRIGGRWKGAVVWWLRTEPRGFNELRRLIPGVSSRVLTNQLRQLESDGLICREESGSRTGRVEYSLSELGRALLPLLDSMQAWGRKHLAGSR